MCDCVSQNPSIPNKTPRRIDLMIPDPDTHIPHRLHLRPLVPQPQHIEIDTGGQRLGTVSIGAVQKDVVHRKPLSGLRGQDGEPVTPFDFAMVHDVDFVRRDFDSSPEGLVHVAHDPVLVPSDSEDARFAEFEAEVDAEEGEGVGVGGGGEGGGGNSGVGGREGVDCWVVADEGDARGEVEVGGEGDGPVVAGATEGDFGSAFLGVSEGGLLGGFWGLVKVMLAQEWLLECCRRLTILMLLMVLFRLDLDM